MIEFKKKSFQSTRKITINDLLKVILGFLKEYS